MGLGRSDEDVCKIVENKDGKYEESKISEYRKKRFKGMYDDKINPSIISFMGWDIGIEEIEGLVRDISLKEGVVVECRVYSSRFDGYDVKGKKKSEYGRKLNKIRSKMALDGRNIGDIRGIIRREVLKLKEITIEEINEWIGKDEVILKQYKNISGRIWREYNYEWIGEDRVNKFEDRYRKYEEEEIIKKYGSVKEKDRREYEDKEESKYSLHYDINLRKIELGELSKSKRMIELEEVEIRCIKIGWNNRKILEREIERIKKLQKEDLRYVYFPKEIPELMLEGFMCSNGERIKELDDVVDREIVNELDEEKESFYKERGEVEFGKVYKEYEGRNWNKLRGVNEFERWESEVYRDVGRSLYEFMK